MIYNHHFPKPALDNEGIAEIPEWAEPTRVIVLTAGGVRQWRCEGLASNITPESLRVLADLLELAEERAMHGASSPLASHPVPVADESREA